jgi:SAM-dependent methyltransferase
MLCVEHRSREETDMSATLDFDALAKPLPFWSPKAWYYAAARGLLGTVGRLSKGIRLGLDRGFDSGVMLDYVYENRPRGSGGLGRAIDRMFLNAPGWQGIRNRGRLIEEKIAGAVREAAPRHSPVRLADLACGGGRYVLNALKSLGPEIPVAATLRDYRRENVDKAAANAAALGLDVAVEQADAFADYQLARLGPVDVAIVSGLHEIIPDDRKVEAHFSQVAKILAPGGRLLLTVQPDHPQLEFIARVLRSHTGKPWAMRLRPLDLTLRSVEAAGLVPESVDMEPLGIFGVLSARKA